MAKYLWGKVFYQDQFAGYLRQEPGERYTFTYDDSYLNAALPAIAKTLPLTDKPHISEQYLPSFFDNLVAEGWLEDAQRRLLGKRTANRFELLLGFGLDCAGAVSIIDPDPVAIHTEKLDHSDPTNVALFHTRASLSGIQPKLLLVEENGQLRPTHYTELSTHIAKLPSHTITDITYNEWITLSACKALLPEDDFVEAALQPLPGICEEALIIKRFDRTHDLKRIHFEEYNQLLNHQTVEKYDGAYKDMADFIYNDPMCSPTEAYRLFKRILVALITGNTDMHLKNFAMFHTEQGFRLTPNYDQVAAATYKPYQYVALAIQGASDRIIGQLKPKNIIALGHEFRLKDDAILMAINDIERQIEAAKDAASQAYPQKKLMTSRIITFMEKRWAGTFSLIGQQLSKKR